MREIAMHISYRKIPARYDCHIGSGVFFDRKIFGDASKIAVSMLMEEILFGLNGLFIRKLRHENGLTYSVDQISACTSYVDRFGVFAEIRPDRIEFALDIIDRVFSEDLSKLISQETVNKYISIIEARERRRFRTTDNLIESYSEAFASRGEDMIWYDEYVSKLKTLSVEEILEIITETFDPKRKAVLIFKSSK